MNYQRLVLFQHFKPAICKDTPQHHRFAEEQTHTRYGIHGGSDDRGVHRKPETTGITKTQQHANQDVVQTHKRIVKYGI